MYEKMGRVSKEGKITGFKHASKESERAAGMSPDWITCKLTDVCSSVDYGYTASAKQIPVGPHFLRITDIVDGHIAWESVPYVDADDGILDQYRLNDGDIVIARTGASTGSSAYIKHPPKAVFASYLVRLKIKPEFSPRFIAYYLKSDQFLSYIRGVLGDKSAQPNASARTMVGAPLHAPSDVSKQHEISQILGVLDDKIELNKKMNETLEGIAQAIFKSWFIDFDPVRAKMEGHKPFGINDATAALFPDSIEDSELGKIPKGWKIGTLGEVADNPRRGIGPDQIKYGTPYIALKHMPRRSVCLSDWGYSDSLGSNKFRFNKGEILFGKLRPYFHKVGVAPISGVCSTDILVVSPKEPQWFGFVLGHISSAQFVNHVDAGSTGTKMPRANWAAMAGYEVALPPEELATAFTNIIRPSVEKILANIHESRTLAILRDTLLPKLLSGDLRASKIEHKAVSHA